MKRPTRVMVRTAFGHLLAGLVLMSVGLTGEALGADARWSVLRYPALHLLVVGWLTQLILGVALWLFPLPARPPSPPAAVATWAGYGLLNAGLALRVAGEAGPAYGASGWPEWALAASAIAQAAAAWLFAALLWPRARASTREAGHRMDHP